jgi:hypothetical protein
MKRIVTHHSPDIDALACVWLIHRFMPGWEDATVELVSSGLTLNSMEPDKDPDILHVDTGFGRFDHHHTSEFTCAARLVFNELKRKKYLKDHDAEAIERMMDVVTRYDHFQEINVPNPDDDIHIFSLAYVIFGLRINPSYTQRLIEMSEESLDGILQYMKGKVHAEHIIDKGFVFQSYWGKTLVIETDNDKSMKVAFMKGYDMVIRYSPQYKNVAIKIHPTSKKTLKRLEKKIVPHDPGAYWFYHASGRMLLNASTRDTRDMPTKYSLKELLDIVKGFN